MLLRAGSAGAQQGSRAKTGLAEGGGGGAALTLSLGLLVALKTRQPAQIRVAYAEPLVNKPRLNCRFSQKWKLKPVSRESLDQHKFENPPARSLPSPEGEELGNSQPAFCQDSFLVPAFFCL